MFQKIKNIYHFAQAFASAIYFNFPSKKLIVIGVTGTDGKTTTVSMIYHILRLSGKKVSMISSIGATIENRSTDTGYHVSTPSPWQVQKLLAKAVDLQTDYFIVEATSHGLDQNRLAFVDFKVAVLTNITEEHLDYHQNFASLTKAKSKLFSNAQISVLNADDSSFKDMKPIIKNKLKTYSLKSKSADFSLKNFPLEFKVIGDFNKSNALAAAAATNSVEIPYENIVKALHSFKLPKGRMHELDEGQNFKVVVDFAHTPNGLKNALSSLKASLREKGRLITVFGAAGKRWEAKRELMGTISSKLADLTIITSEDPRQEDPLKIARQIAQGLIRAGKAEGKDFFIKVNRAEAIKFATSLAKTGDTVAFFGKGHEKSMNIKGRELPWDEIAEVTKALKALK